MLPSLLDWVRNPQKAITDLDTYNVAAEAVTQPLVAYQKEIAGIRTDRVHRRTAIVFAAALTVAPFLPIKWPVGETEILGATMVSISSIFAKNRGIRARHAATVTLRELYPSERNQKQFSLIENIFNVTPTPNPKDIPDAQRRATIIREYARRLNIKLANF